MILPSLKALETILGRYVKERYYPRRVQTLEFTEVDLRFFARGVAEVSAAFTSERATLPKNYFNRKEFRSGYLLYFVLSNFPKALNCLEQIRVAERFAASEVVRVLDLGSGPGTASLAALEYWKVHAPAQRLACTLIDQNAEILRDARSLFAMQAGIPPLPSPLPPRERGSSSLAICETHTVDLGWKNLAAALQRQPFNLIFCMNMLNELGDLHARHRLVSSLMLHHLTPNGVLILIEPGLQRTTRELMELRDMLAPSNIIAPCLHNAPCPMIKHNKRDWCHFYLDWERPKIVADLDRLIGNRKEYLKFSYLILAQGSTPPQPSPYKGEGAYRVVSAPLRSKGKTELLLCPAVGSDTSRLHRIVRLDKDRNLANADLDRVMRGDIVECAQGGRVGKTTCFKIIHAMNL